MDKLDPIEIWNLFSNISLRKLIDIPKLGEDFPMHVFDKRYFSEYITKDNLSLSHRSIYHLYLFWTGVSQDIKIANEKHMKSYSTSLLIKEIYVLTTIPLKIYQYDYNKKCGNTK